MIFKLKLSKNLTLLVCLVANSHATELIERYKPVCSIDRFVLQNQQIGIFLASDNLFDKLALNKTDKRKDRSFY